MAEKVGDWQQHHGENTLVLHPQANLHLSRVTQLIRPATTTGCDNGFYICHRIGIGRALFCCRYQSPIEQKSTKTDQNAFKSTPSVDQLQAAELAASTADVVNLSVASAVSNLSISLPPRASSLR